jgi:hypothetical protein
MARKSLRARAAAQYRQCGRNLLLERPIAQSLLAHTERPRFEHILEFRDPFRLGDAVHQFCDLDGPDPTGGVTEPGLVKRRLCLLDDMAEVPATVSAMAFPTSG